MSIVAVAFAAGFGLRASTHGRRLEPKPDPTAHAVGVDVTAASIPERLPTPKIAAYPQPAKRQVTPVVASSQTSGVTTSPQGSSTTTATKTTTTTTSSRPHGITLSDCNC
jgi:hypothetical protein